MAGSQDDYRRRRSPSDSPDYDRRRRTRDEDYTRSRRRDDHRSSYKDSPRERSHSPSRRGSHKSDREHRRRGHKDRTDSSDGDRRRRHRYPSPEDRERHRRRRDRDAYDERERERERPSRRRRSRSASRSSSHSRRRSRSPSSSQAFQRSRRPLPSQADAYGSSDLSKRGNDSPAPPAEKEKPNFGVTGRLAAESNTVNVAGGSVVLKYHEPPEARKPPAKEPWRLYVFKGDDMLEVVELRERSCWLVGREHLVVDFALEHPSCSKQHAALQFRFIEKRNEFGDRVGKVKPYIIDLESANGTSVNGDPIPAGRFVEIMDKDVIRFGLSTREYVLMLPPPES